MKLLIWLNIYCVLIFIACHPPEISNEHDGEDSTLKIVVTPSPPVITIDSSCAELRVYPSMGWWWVAYRYKNQEEWHGFKRYHPETHTLSTGQL